MKQLQYTLIFIFLLILSCSGGVDIEKISNQSEGDRFIDDHMVIERNGICVVCSVHNLYGCNHGNADSFNFVDCYKARQFGLRFFK